MFMDHFYRHKIEIEEIIECALKELNLEIQLNGVEEEWVEQVLVAPYALCMYVCVCVHVCVCVCVCMCVCVCISSII